MVKARESRRKSLRNRWSADVVRLGLKNLSRIATCDIVPLRDEGRRQAAAEASDAACRGTSYVIP